MIASPGASAGGADEDDHQSGDRSRKGDPEVGFEFVPHGAALSVAGGNGGIGDKGKIVSNMAPPMDRADT